MPPTTAARPKKARLDAPSSSYSSPEADEAEALEHLVRRAAAEVGCGAAGVAGCVALLAEGLEVPFIVRYRAHLVGNLGGPEAHAVADLWRRHRALAGSRAKVLAAASGAGALSPELRALVLAAATGDELDDLHAPFKPPARGTLGARAAKVEGVWIVV